MIHSALNRHPSNWRFGGALLFFMSPYNQTLPVQIWAHLTMISIGNSNDTKKWFLIMLPTQTNFYETELSFQRSRWAHLKIFPMVNPRTQKQSCRMDQQVSRSMIYYIMIYYIMIKNLELNHLSPEWNLHWGEGTPNRWYERSEKVPNGLRPLIEV